MTTDELAAHLGIATSTIRTWTGKAHFGQYFSQAARSTGARRYFDDQDARIMALIVALKAEQKSPDDIHATLQGYQANDWRSLPELPPAPSGIEPVSMIPREAAEKEINVQRAALMREISLLQEKVDDLEGELKSERTDKQRVMQELADTRQRLGELEGKLSERKSADYWLSRSAVVVIAVIIIAGVVILLVLAVRGGA